MIGIAQNEVTAFNEQHSGGLGLLKYPAVGGLKPSDSFHRSETWMSIGLRRRVIAINHHRRKANNYL